MKKWLTLVLALAICLVPMSAFAIDYPVDSDVTLIMWKQLDGSIAEGGYTTSNETPGFMKWVEDTGIKVEIQEYADSNSLVLALNGASTLPDMYTVDAVNFGGVMSMVNPDAKDRDTVALITYIADEDKFDKLLENQQIIKTPVVRNGRQATLGYQPDVWKKWE